MLYSMNILSLMSNSYIVTVFYLCIIYLSKSYSYIKIELKFQQVMGPDTQKNKVIVIFQQKLKKLQEANGCQYYDAHREIIGSR